MNHCVSKAILQCRAAALLDPRCRGSSVSDRAAALLISSVGSNHSGRAAALGMLSSLGEAGCRPHLSACCSSERLMLA